MAKKRKVDDDDDLISDTKDEQQVDDVEEEEEEDDESQEEEEEQQRHEVGEGEEEEDEEDVAKLLEPFNKEQLIDILRAAASDHPKILEEIHRVADLDPAHRKLFVHGLGWETTSEKLRDFFSQYGELEDCNVVVDKSTGKSKGYGFLLFKHRSNAQKALKEPQKKIESRMTACQLASSGPVNPSHPQHQQQQQQQQQPQHPQHQQHAHSGYQSSQDTLQRKIYVGNVHSEIPGDRLLAFFSKYGEIEEGPLGFDKLTGKAKGYALFIYKTAEGARKALEEPSKSFDGHQLYCQKATDSHKQKGGGPAHVGNVQSGGEGGYIAGGYNVPGGVGFNAHNGAMAHQASAMLGQGFMGGAQGFGQGIPQIQAALAVLAAAGQNPAAFGVPPVVSPLNPGLATMPQAMQGYGMGNTVYQNPQAHQANSSYPTGATGQGSATRPPTMGPMGGYVAR